MTTPLHRPVCDLLGCRYPLVLAGMGGVARAELVTAVSRAGCFGFLGVVREPVERIRAEVAAVRAAGVERFGVNLIPAGTDPALLTAQIGPEGVLVIDALTFVASALVLAAIGVGRQAVGSSKVSTQLLDGWRAVATDPYVRRVSWLFPAASVGILGSEALLTPYVKFELERSEAIIGWLAAAISVGVLLTAAGLRSHPGHGASVRQTAHLAVLGGSGATAAFALAPNLGGATLAFAFVGVVFASRVPTMVILGQRIDDNVRASAMSVVDGAYAVAQLVAAIGAGALAEVTDPRLACLVFAGSTALVGLVATAVPARAPRAAVVS